MGWPFGLPSGVDFWLQAIVQDGGVPAGLSLSNAQTATTPWRDDATAGPPVGHGPVHPG